jgi:hypothetical protein
MDRIEFLKLRIAALEQSIHSNKKMINLCEIAKDVDDKTQKTDIAELDRRIRIDRELLAVRQAELRE